MTSRVAIFLPSLAGGGAERVMLMLAERIVSRGMNCDIIIAITKGQFINAVPDGVRLIRLGKQKTIFATFALASYLRRVQPDVLLATVFTANISALLAAMISFTGTRTVTCEANPIDWDVKGRHWWQTLINKLAVTVLYRHADAIIAVSTGVREALLRNHLTSPELIYVIPNPIPLPSLSKENSVVSRTHTLIACGRLEFQKDHSTLLRVFARLLERIDTRLVILGEGSLREELENQAKELGVDEAVFFAGFDPEPCSYMRTASVFVHTARYEGFGVVLLEALASGCTVVAVDCPGGIRDVLADGKYGALVPVGNDEQLIDTLEAALTGKLKLADPREHLRQFNIDIIADAYLSVLLDSASSKQP